MATVTYPYAVKVNGEIYPPNTDVPVDENEKEAKTENVPKAGKRTAKKEA